MASTSETGHAVNIGNLKKLIDAVSLLGARYVPPTDRLRLSNLNNVHIVAVQSMLDVDVVYPSWVNAVDARSRAFEPLDKRVTRVLLLAETIPINATALKALKEIVRKIHGTRAKPKELVVSDSGNETAEPAHRYISVSQRSFEQRIEHFIQLISLLQAEPDYLPNEADLTIAGLNALLASMRSTNDAAVAASLPLDNARTARNVILYAPNSGLVSIGLDVKKYIRGAFGSNSSEYAQVKGIEFRKIN